MFQTLKNAWVIKEIRNKILFTVMIILIFRVGSVIPVPFVNPDVLKAATESNSFFNYLSILTGGGLEYGAIFALSVTPYINSSIIVQLLTVVFTKLQEWSKEVSTAHTLGNRRFGFDSGYCILYLSKE